MAEIITSLVPSLAGLESMLEALADLQMKTFKEACQVRREGNDLQLLMLADETQGTYDSSMITPPKINMDTPKWRFGRWFSSSMGWFLGSMLIFRGVTGMMLLSWKGCLLNIRACQVKTMQESASAIEWREWIKAWAFWNCTPNMFP